SSWASTFEPSPIVSTVTPRSFAQRSASCSCSIVAGRVNQRAGPPVPIVVYRASGTFSSTPATLAPKQADGSIDIACAENEQHVAAARAAGETLCALLDRRR